MDDREAYIRAFKTPGKGVNKLFLSRVGDVALDVPDANVIIQISSHFGSRLQEAQRMGRILRKGVTKANDSYFYTLISTDTLEVYFANKRRRYLVDQGYAYKVIMAGSLGGGGGGGGGGLGREEEGLSGGMDDLFRRSSFLGTREQQLRVMELVSREWEGWGGGGLAVWSSTCAHDRACRRRVRPHRLRVDGVYNRASCMPTARAPARPACHRVRPQSARPRVRPHDLRAIWPGTVGVG
jgi:hypothetical protein